ncbi:MAG: polysaccharide biosynthesis/export family protein [Pirellulaceae bacterium]
MERRVTSHTMPHARQKNAWLRRIEAAFAAAALAVIILRLGQSNTPDSMHAGPGVTAVATSSSTSRTHLPSIRDVCAQRDGEPTEIVDVQGRVKRVRHCQMRCVLGVDCQGCNCCGEKRWHASRPVPWEVFAQGEYVGVCREADVPEYRLRVGDELEFVYRLTGIESNEPYKLNVGDRVRIESMTDPALDRELLIQPDGMITLRVLGQIRAARRTVAELRDELEERYVKYYKVPAISVTPVQVNSRLEELRAAVDGRHGPAGGQSQQSRVTPEGTIQLPAIGSVPAQCLTLDELKQEIDERYAQVVEGVAVTPRIRQRAARYVYVVGEVRQPGRYTLEAPTTVMQSIALAGGWNNGGNLRQIVVFRRTEEWRLIATKLDLHGPLLGKRPCPADEIWLRDSDLVVVPKSRLLRSDDLIERIFHHGNYGALPVPRITCDTRRLSSL